MATMKTILAKVESVDSVYAARRLALLELLREQPFFPQVTNTDIIKF